MWENRDETRRCSARLNAQSGKGVSSSPDARTNRRGQSENNTAAADGLRVETENARAFGLTAHIAAERAINERIKARRASSMMKDAA